MTKLIVVTGPTAVGKTEAAIALAERVGGEIISADSMQVYKYMDIGTAKPGADDLSRARHHMLDVVAPDEGFSVARYQLMARACITDVADRGKTPILAGGSGFYINAVLKDIDFAETLCDDAYRQQLLDIAASEGNARLHCLLKDIDPASHQTIHPNNVKRVVRALEFYKQTGMRISEANAVQKKSESFYDADIYILNMDRQLLYERIGARTDAMFAAGLADEVKSLLARGYTADMPAMQGLGYKEVSQYLAGAAGYADTVDRVKQATRNYAKRQLTWFKHQMTGTWIDSGKASLIKRGFDAADN